MLSAYADEHVKSGIVEALRRRGMDIVTAQERRQRQTDDDVLLAAATSESRLMLTNDPDFLKIHAEWLASGRSHAGIVFWQQNLGIGEAMRRILQYALKTTPEDAANNVKFL